MIWVKRIASVIAGVLLGGVVFWILQLIGFQIFTLPEGMDPMDLESIIAHASQISTTALIYTLFTSLASIAVGGWAGASIAGSAHIAIGTIIGAFFLLSSINNLMAIPYPMWYLIMYVLIPIPAGWYGGKLAAK